MLQLSKNQALNTVAFYPNILITGSQLLFEYTQSYNQNSGSFPGTIISNPRNTPYLIVTISGSTLPSASGQYILYSRGYEPSLPIWNLVTTPWNLNTSTWNAAGTVIVGDIISEDRAWISGSDVEPITEYVSPNEDAYYITYLE
jgi:hypothetical protein